ncbi:hypothetical protein K438DRAFT_1857189, partial [Mycena galopus ATCC 62051]
MRWLFGFWSRRVDARRAAVRQEKSRATGDSVKRDAARNALLICGCSPYHVAAFARRFCAVRNARLARLGLARVLGSRVCGKADAAPGVARAHIGSARQRPGIARGARHPAFWLVTPLCARIFCGMGTRGSPRKSMMLRESWKSTREVPCSSQPSLMRSSTQLRRCYSIAQTMTTQQGSAQGPCGAADLSERVPVASGRLHTRKSDVAPRKGFLRPKTA